MRKCNSCRFCCWSFAVTDINKQALNHCGHECKQGCKIHEKSKYPPSCKLFICPYLNGEKIQRPDKYQNLLKELNGNIGNYIPAIPINFKAKEVKETILKTRSIPAFIMINNDW